ncbi:MAG: hypothetical protein KBT30_00295 [Clostridiales bacterium]|nr:hypothetical protein [Candidatus Apopatousia equi]
MINNKSKIKNIIAIILSVIILALYLKVLIFGEAHYVEGFLGIPLAFLISALFLDIKNSKAFITYALLLNSIADVFLVLTRTHQEVGVSIFILAQICYMIYTLMLDKKLWVKLVNISSRVIISVVAVVVLKSLFNLELLEMLSVIYITNSCITCLFLGVHIKTKLLMFIGFILFILCDIVVGLTWGGAEILNLSGAFIDLLYKFDFAFLFYVPGIYLISLSSIKKTE